MRSSNEEVFIEQSINSVRVSIKIKKMDDLDKLLCHKFAAFLTQRAEKFLILRRKPIKVLFNLLDFFKNCIVFIFRTMILVF